jgi:hypothetical protein
MRVKITFGVIREGQFYPLTFVDLEFGVCQRDVIRDGRILIVLFPGK